jgi:hypothetical protein
MTQGVAIPTRSGSWCVQVFGHSRRTLPCSFSDVFSDESNHNRNGTKDQADALNEASAVLFFSHLLGFAASAMLAVVQARPRLTNELAHDSHRWCRFVHRQPKTQNVYDF